MKVTSIEIHPDGSSSFCDLSFRDPKRENPYNIKGVFGLDAEVIIPRYYGVSGNQALKYYNLMVQSREIILRIELNPQFAVNESYSDLRDNLAKMIAATRTGLVELKFKNVSNVVAVASGFIKKFEAPLSTKTPEVQITIECTDPMLKAPAPVSVDLTGFDPGYTILVDDDSTAPHGFTFEMLFTGKTNTITVQDPTDMNWIFQITPFGGFLAGDVLHFSSEPKNKYLYLDRAGFVMHLADSITFESVWPIMFPGDNAFTFASASLMSWQDIQFTPTYWGI